MTQRICLFAHFDAERRIAPHVMHYLQQIRDCGFTTHLALSGMDRLSVEQIDRLRQLDVVPHFRRNVGHDFGAWQELVERGCVGDADTILLANDSVFGPLAPLMPIFRTMQSGGADVWGMVESREAGWHLQSWFLCFSRAAFLAPAITRVLRQPFQAMGKSEIVLHGELGLGAAIQASGLRWHACSRQPARRLRRLLPANAMHVDYLTMLRTGGVPFVKVELLRDNPAAIPWVGRWRDAVAQSPIFRTEWIDGFLSPAGQHTAPRPRRSLRLRLLYAAISRDQPEAALSLLR